MATRFESAITRFGSLCIRAAAHLAFGAAVCFPSAAAAQGMPPWTSAKEPLARDDVNSVLVRARDEPLFTLPSASAPRRGAAAKGARLPFYGSARGPGCQADWLLVGP